MASPSGSINQHQSKKRKIDFGEDVIILVGNNKQRFVAHRDALCKTSDFFKAACSDKWRKSRDKTIRLPEQRPVAFSIYLNWRYEGTIDLWNGDEEPSKAQNGDGKMTPTLRAGPRYSRLIQCYVLGDMLGDHQFCNALIDSWFELVAETNRIPETSLINKIFLDLPNSTSLRLLVTHQLAYDANPACFEQKLDRYTPEVWKAVAKVTVMEKGEELTKKCPIGRGQCFYHGHKEGEEKCS